MHYRFWIMPCVLIFMSACAPSEVLTTAPTALPSVTETSTAAPTPTTVPLTPDSAADNPTLILTPTIAPSPTPTPMPLPAPVERLEGDGPWLLFLAAVEHRKPTYLWASSVEHPDPVLVLDQPVVNYAIHPQKTVDGKIQIAIVTTSPENQYYDVHLNLLTLPELQLTQITPLTTTSTAFSGFTDENQVEREQELFQLAGALVDYQGLAWSPDGKWLAFVGAQEGQSADVYSYEVSTGTIRQLTSGEGNAFQLLWSPDSRTILHSSKFCFECPGSLYGYGIWGVPPDEQNVTTYSNIGGERFIGWLDATHLLFDIDDYLCYDDVVVLDTITGITESIAPLDCVGDIVYQLEYRIALVRHGNVGLGEGIYIYYLESGTFFRVIDGFAFSLSWDDDLGAFYTNLIPEDRNDYGVAINTAGELFDLPPYNHNVSPDGRYDAYHTWYWVTPHELWLSRAETNAVKIPVVANQGVVLEWSPDISAFAYFTYTGDYYLYLVDAVNAKPTELTTGFFVPSVHPYPVNRWYAQWTP